MTTKTKTKFCGYCGNRFAYVRDDAQFCSARCTAAWTRGEGYQRERFHEEKSERNAKACEHCGTEFYFNEYAQRGGQRVPQYCSNRCRTAAWRAKHKESSFDGGANRWQEGRNDKTQRKGTSHRTERERQEDQDNAREEARRARERAEKTYKHTSQNEGDTKHTSQTARDKDTSQKIDPRWLSKDPYTVLGVTYVSTKAQIKRAWLKLCKEWHPDICKHPHATRIMQAINAAWAKLDR